MTTEAPAQEAIETKEPEEIPKNRVFLPIKGNSWNPYRSYPRNYPCFCGSGNKFKKCCERNLNPTIPSKDLEKIKAHYERTLETIKVMLSQGVWYKKAPTENGPVQEPDKPREPDSRDQQTLISAAATDGPQSLPDSKVDGSSIGASHP